MTKNLLPRLLKQSLDKIMSNRFSRYSKYIIQDRALPDVRDGLKPVQRRILFAMNELGLTHNKPYKKSARIVGEVIGKYHPHGDSSIYEALVRMSQNWKINLPLISMHGNNGSIDNDPAAAMRYTEVRLAKITNELLRGIRKNTVSFSSNFDDSEIEPTVLPAGFPNLIINGAKGIAAGYATEMPPHNLGEVIDGTIAMIKNPSIKLETLITYIKGPDFPTGGIVQGFDGIYSAFEKGKGKIIIRSKVKVVDSKDQHLIIINEIPYGVIKSKLVRDIDEIRYNKNIHGIKEIRDETDRNGISIVIELMRNTNTKFILNYLYSKTDLQIYYNYNNVVIKNRAPKLLSLTDLISCFIMHQTKIQRNLLEFELNKDKNRLEVILGLIKVADIFDEVVEIIKKTSGSKQGVIKALMLKFNFTKVQTNAIAELKLYRLSSADQSIYKKERDELCKRINNIEQIISDKNKFNNYLIKLLKEIKKHFAIKRKTILEEKIDKIELNNEKLIEHKDIFIGISKLGYIKSLSKRSFDSNKFKDYGLKEGDSIVFLEKVNTSYKMLIFTSEGRYIYIPSYLVSESKFKSVGHHINNYSSLTPEEKIVSVISTKNFSYQAVIILVTKFGKAKRVKLGSLKVSRFKKPLIAIKIKLNNDKLIDAKVSNGDKKLIIITSNTKTVHYSESLLPIQGPKSYGVIGILLKNNYVTSFSLVEFHDILAIISDKGGLKRIKVSKIPQTKRIATGKSIYKTSKLNPHYIIYSDVVNPNTEILFFENKQIIIYNAKKIPINSLAMRLSKIGPKSIIDGKIKKYQIINNLF